MSFLKYAIPALAAFEATLAQSSSCSVDGTTTISAAADATAIAACPTFTGNIALSTDAPATLSLDGTLEEIDGDLVGQNATTVQTISAANVKRITGDFRLNGMTVLSSVSFNELNNIGGQLLWVSLPNLAGLTFGTGVQRIGQVTITDTQIQDLSGINIKSAAGVNIGQNARLNTLSWQTSTIDNSLTFDNNGGDAGFNATFGNLQSVGDISITGVTGLIMNALKNVTGTVSIYNTTAESFIFPNLTTTGDFSILDNDQLTNVSFPILRTVSALGIQRNPMLTMNVDFPALANIASINCTGAFNELDLPKANRISGAVSIKSSGKLDQTCSNVKQLQRNGVITARNPVCSGSSNDPTTTGSDGSGTSDGSSASSTAAAVSNYIVPSAITFTSLFAAMLGMAL